MSGLATGARAGDCSVSPVAAFVVANVASVQLRTSDQSLTA